MATSPRNGKRRGPAATATGEGVAAVLAAALEMERTGSSELHPPSALTNLDEPDARPAANGSPIRTEAGEDEDDRAAIVPNGAEPSGPDAVAQHCPSRALQGYIDAADADAIRGWAWDPQTPG